MAKLTCIRKKAAEAVVGTRVVVVVVVETREEE